MRRRLTGLALEYAILEIYSRDAGQRSAKIAFNVGQGTQDIGFRNDVMIVFTALPARRITLRVKDEKGRPTMASFVIRDRLDRIYPLPAKRLAPDFFFQPQIYRADGETVQLPAGYYTVQYSGGPEYVPHTREFDAGEAGPNEISFQLDRWIDPSQYGWYSGDHHIHAAGCSHYMNPTEGVEPRDMIRQILGETSEHRQRADLGSRLLLPEAVLLRQRPSAFQAGPHHALRSGGFRLSLQPRGPHRSAESEAAGLSGRQAHRGLAHVGPAHLALGQIPGRGGRVRAFGLGPPGLRQGTSVARNARLRRHWRQRVHRRCDASGYGGFHLRRRHAVRVGAEHLVPHAERGLPDPDRRRDRFPVHL